MKKLGICLLLFLLLLCLASCTDTEDNDAIVMPYSSEDYVNGIIHRDKVVRHFEELGFEHIVFEESNPFADNPDCAIIEIEVQEGLFSSHTWESGDTFTKEDIIRIVFNDDAYVNNYLTHIPILNEDCLGRHYEEIEEIFEDAGFTHVYPWSYDIEATDEFPCGSVLKVTIGDDDFDSDATFSLSSKYRGDTEIYIHFVSYAQEDEVTEATTTREDEPTTDQKDEVMVWISSSGSKYHRKKGCSGMEDPVQISKEEAIARGYEACKRCN